MSDLVFYHNPMSRGRIVHWMLEETGAPYEVRLLSFDKREHKSPEFLQINPMGKIPAIVHGGTVVTEAAAICAYLADAFPSANLAPPAGSAERGTYYRWLFFASGCMEPAMVDKLRELPSTGPPSMLGYGTYEDALNALESALRPGPFLLGERFSAADVYVAASIGWGLTVKALEPRPAFTSYAERCASRPASQRTQEQNARYVEQLRARG